MPTGDIAAAHAHGSRAHGPDRTAASLGCYSGICNGTLGELFQGPLVQDGRAQIAIISLPIRRYSWVHYRCGGPTDRDAELEKRPKCRKAIDLYLRVHGLSLPEGAWAFSSELPWGRGMASSTADIVAAVRCLDAVFDRQSSPAVIATVLREIERSDSVFLESYALYLSGLQEVVRILPGNPVFHVCFIDEQRAIDTEAITPALLAHYADHLSEYQDSMTAMLDAFDRADPIAIARAATQSAVLGQRVVPKHSLAALIENQARFGADGIVVAHTGSLIGYLFVDRPGAMRVGQLSAFFLSLGHQCQYAQAQF